MIFRRKRLISIEEMGEAIRSFPRLYESPISDYPEWLAALEVHIADCFPHRRIK